MSGVQPVGQRVEDGFEIVAYARDCIYDWRGRQYARENHRNQCSGPADRMYDWSHQFSADLAKEDKLIAMRAGRVKLRREHVWPRPPLPVERKPRVMKPDWMKEKEVHNVTPD